MDELGVQAAGSGGQLNDLLNVNIELHVLDFWPRRKRANFAPSIRKGYK